jgi:CBS-domain-containing membrane protein
MRIFDKKVKTHLGSYVFQCFLATLTLLAVLIFLNVLTETAIIAAIGASAFIVFTMPNMYSSDPRRLVGGYIIGIFVGIVFNFISSNNSVEMLFLNGNTSLIVFGALAVGISILLMTITNTEHAPAAGISLGLVINQWSPLTILFIFCAMLWMAIVRKLLKPHLMNLTSPD